MSIFRAGFVMLHLSFCFVICVALLYYLFLFSFTFQILHLWSFALHLYNMYKMLSKANSCNFKVSFNIKVFLLTIWRVHNLRQHIKKHAKQEWTFNINIFYLIYKMIPQTNIELPPWHSKCYGLNSETLVW